MFFQTAIMDSSQAILSQIGLIRKIYFPREIPVIAATGASLIHLLISIMVFVAYRWVLMPVFVGWPGPPAQALLWLPVVLLILGVLTLGISFLVAALNVFYEDVKFIVNISMQFLMWMTPIMYFAENMRYAERIPPALRSPLYHIYLLNPIAWIVGAFKQMFFPPALVPVQGMGHLIITAPFDERYCLIALITSTIICGIGYRVFTNLKWKFAERP
jgi:ABC-2 type transport system permease protein